MAHWIRWIGTAIGIGVAGCSLMETWENPLNPNESDSIRIKVPPLETLRVPWRGWSAIEHRNGLMTLRTVPAAGGRTLSIEIGGDDAILVFPHHEGKTYAADSRDNSVHFGGHYSCIGPERLWSVEEQPFNPHAGPYDATISANASDYHRLHMVSRVDTWHNATISMSRTITVYRGTTHVTVDNRIVNRGTKPLEFYLWNFTQIDGRRGTGKDRPLRNLTTYVPVPRDGDKKVFTAFFPPNAKKEAQFDVSLPTDILAIHYAAEMFKVASHARHWWIATVDHDSGWTYVKAFDVDTNATYVDNNGPIEVFGSGMDFPLGQFVEMELLTGIDTYPPGEGVEQREHWYACICKGPVLSLTPAGVVCEKLSLTRDHDYLDLSGRFGVFYLGSARLEMFNAEGRVVDRSEPISIDPREEFKLSATLPAREDVETIALKVYDAHDRYCGELTHVRVRGTTVKRE